jgi:dienelactone hydrolase
MVGARVVLLSSLMVVAVVTRAEPLAGTAPLTAEGDLGLQMVEGIDRFLMRQTAEAVGRRGQYWNRDSIEPNRQRLAKILGVVDQRVPFDAPELISTTGQGAMVARGEGFEVYAVRWPVVGPIHGEGLLLAPKGKQAVADVVAIPDADQTPEMIAGLAGGATPFARRLAEAGCRVIVPALVGRSDAYSLPPSGQRTNQPDREYVYRPAFEMGRHVIGYEIQKVLAAVDWFERDAKSASIGVMGYGEGGLLAFYAAAIDRRIKTACVSGYFSSRQELWREPIYRNIFGLLREFGDAEVASLIAPRELVIEHCRGPEIDGPPAPRDKRSGAAPGKLVTPDAKTVVEEVERARKLGNERIHLIDGEGAACGSGAAAKAFLGALGMASDLPVRSGAVEVLRKDIDPQARLKRQIDDMQEFTQQLVRQSDAARKAYWAKADRSSVEKWQQTTPPYREAMEKELIGKIEQPLLAANPRTRQVFDEPSYIGYEAMLDVFPDVFTSGILLVPRDIKPGERRPVVVCQHGLEGRARDVADPKVDSHFYHRFACQLAEQGFVTYAPQNPYVGQDRFRVLQRKANPLGLSLFSFIVPQHRQTVAWLASLPFVDPQRIAFYGLSYGGKTAMRVPALVDGYCLSICSADFNEWVWKCTSLTYSAGYPGTGEYEMFEWNLGNTFNYAEMAGLIAPRPFMVERGHHDGVAPDEWVAYEYAKVRGLYMDLKIPQRTEIEFFDGPHTIHGVGTFRFLHEKLNWQR